jgi:MerR family mercuric resistance operon transcriptional regulator
VGVESLTIGQLADAAGVHIETVRYYERRGLLRDPPRSAAGYRQYSRGDLWRLQFIARAKRLGFTLTEVASLVHGHDGNEISDSADSTDSVLAMAHQKIQVLDEQRRALGETRARLARLIDICEVPGSEDCLALRVTS